MKNHYLKKQFVRNRNRLFMRIIKIIFGSFSKLSTLPETWRNTSNLTFGVVLSMPVERNWGRIRWSRLAPKFARLCLRWWQCCQSSLRQHQSSPRFGMEGFGLEMVENKLTLRFIYFRFDKMNHCIILVISET